MIRPRPRSTPARGLGGGRQNPRLIRAGPRGGFVRYLYLANCKLGTDGACVTPRRVHLVSRSHPDLTSCQMQEPSPFYAPVNPPPWPLFTSQWDGVCHCLTPPWCEQAPRLFLPDQLVPSLQIAPTGGAGLTLVEGDGGDGGAMNAGSGFTGAGGVKHLGWRAKRIATTTTSTTMIATSAPISTFTRLDIPVFPLPLHPH